MKKVAFVHKDIGDQEKGGVSVSYKALIKGFLEKGWCVYVITQREFKNTSAKVIDVPFEKDCEIHSRNVAKVLNDIEVDIVEASNYKFELLEYLKTRKTKTPKIVIRCNPSCVTLLFGTHYLNGEETQSQLADCNISVSDFTKHDIEHYYNVDESQVIYEGVDLDNFFSMQNKSTLSTGLSSLGSDDPSQIRPARLDEIISKDKINIFWCGKPTPMKGYDYLEKLIANSPDDFRFILNTTKIDISMSWGKEYGSKCVFVWDLAREDQLNIWRRCNVTLVTSRVEGLSYVTMESLLLGKPVIANQQCTILKEFPTKEYIHFFNPIQSMVFESLVRNHYLDEVEIDNSQMKFFDSKRLVEETEGLYSTLLESK